MLLAFKRETEGPEISQSCLVHLELHESDTELCPLSICLLLRRRGKNWEVLPICLGRKGLSLFFTCGKSLHGLS